MKIAPDSKFPTPNSKDAFTLLEILITVAIFVVVTVVIFASLVTKKNTTAFNSIVQETVTTLREAQSRSISQENGVLWGAHFDNSSTPPFFALYKGFYSPSNVVGQYSLPPSVSFSSSSISRGSSIDIVFAPISGLPSTSTSIVFQQTSGSGGSGGVIVSSTITINPTGLISYGQPTSGLLSPFQYTLTITPGGTGIGTVTSDVGGINCGSTCVGSYASGTVVTLTATTNNSSFFASWSGGGCSGFGTCVVTITANAAVTPTFTSSIQSTFFGIHLNVPSALFGDYTKSHAYPNYSFGTQRLWDTKTRWQTLEPGSSRPANYTWADLDGWLQNAKSNGVNDVLLPLSGTPNWASSNSATTTCDYNSIAPGSCGVPTDLAVSCTNVNGANNCDGKTDGPNQFWRDWIYAMAAHINGVTVLGLPGMSNGTIPGAYAGWNEFTRNASDTITKTFAWVGTNDQLVRLMEDATCIIKGTGTITNGTGGAPETCTAAHMFRATSRFYNGGSPTATVGVQPTALIVTPDSVLILPDSNILQAFYGATDSVGYADIIGVHGYVQTGTCCAAAERLVTLWSTLQSILPAAATGKPIWSTEGSGGKLAIFTQNQDTAASFLARYFLICNSVGFARCYWYSNDTNVGQLWAASGTSIVYNSQTVGPCNDGGTGLGCFAPAATAYQQVYSWMVGKALTSSCVSVGTVWSCGFSGAGGLQAQAMWDTSQTCDGTGNCTTATSTVANQYIKYKDLLGNTIAIVNDKVPVGLKPIFLLNQ